MIVETTIHSFSLWHHFAHKPGFDAIAFADLARSLGFQGISLSLNDGNYRHLGGREVERTERLCEYLETHNMSLEVDTSDTTPSHMSEMLKVAHKMGATSLRTYTRHNGSVQNMMEATTRDFGSVVDEAEALGIIIVLENHEDFTGPELAEIVEAVNHPNLKILYDYGNSQMVLEDPESALDAVLPHIYSVHFKDHVMIRPEHAGQLTVAGVPIGKGFLPLERLTRRILDQGLRRITFENVWAYSAPIRKGRTPLADVILGEGSFAYMEPPFKPACVILDQSNFTGEQLVELEYQALLEGVEAYHSVLQNLDCTGHWVSVANRSDKLNT